MDKHKEYLDQLLDRLQSGQLLTEETFAGLDADRYLDEREQSPFDEQWMEAFRRWGQDAETENDDNESDAGREAAFKQTFRHTGNPDLAGYVSDDIGLICSALKRGGEEDPFILDLLRGYMEGKLPLR
ncbi:hypothetical protein A7K91_01490 [Paenibacillus oryzae]|uniref:Uncharacterized protein n=1 Tax=Paenibacillus oryzae TaxID=1844972 RepID=A0A1A5YAA8_9BACL|nr:hypothetical protein [Paenibacillus oryzae]OBR62320.1 hypothetical protein A7K91_01490 [Paenibacillus oryzae]